MLTEDQVLKTLLKREWRTCGELAKKLSLPANERSPIHVLLRALVSGLVTSGGAEKRIRPRPGQGKGRGRDEFRRI